LRGSVQPLFATGRPAPFALTFRVRPWTIVCVTVMHTAKSHATQESPMADEATVNDLLLAWEDAVDAGADPSPEELCRAHPELIERVRAEVHKLKRMRPDRGPLDAGPPQEEFAHLRYQPVQLHARGGVGEVFVARDQELRRLVAVKRIRDPAYVDDTSKERFLWEAEITAHLEHPGMVPVYGAGIDAGGRPYYAMRLVRGVNLHEAITAYHGTRAGTTGDGQAAALRGLLGRLIAACNAVAYAHSRGIIHRDLKPANILLGDFGETLVGDWGLARKIGPPSEVPVGSAGIGAAEPGPVSTGSARTEAGTILGTPAYMSPEQARGEPTVGPASDVFSLGATLYHLLTGRPPYQGPMAVAEAAAHRFPAPRTLARQVPSALVAICLKAMARRPDDRYADPLALAQDLDRWLAGEPVSAWREPLSVRSWRWMNRHRTWTVAAATGLVVALAVSVAALVRINTSEREARVAAKHAEENFDLALDQNLTLGELGDELQGLAMTNRRTVERILKTAEARNAELLARAHASGRVLRHRAQLLTASAGLYVDLGTTQPAKERLDEALAIYDGLAQTEADPPLRDWGHAWRRLGDIHLRRGKITECVRAWERAIELYRRSTPAETTDYHIARCVRAIGEALWSRGDTRGGALKMEEAYRVFQQRAQEKPDDAARKADLARSLWWRPGARNALGRPVDALRCYEDALDMLDQALKQRPENALWLRAKAEHHLWLGSGVYAPQGKNQLARQHCDAALAIVEPLAKLDPDNADWQLLVVLVRLLQDNLPDATVSEALTRARLEEIRRLQRLFTAMTERDPEQVRYRSLLAKSYVHEGNTLAIAQDRGVRTAQQVAPEITAAYGKAVDVMAAAVQAAPEAHDYAVVLGSYMYQLLGVLRNQGRTAEADAIDLQKLRLAVTTAQRRTQYNPSERSWQLDLAKCHCVLGHTLNERSQHVEARAELEAALAIQERFLQGDAATAEALSHHAQAIDCYAGMLGDAAVMLREYRRALEVRQRVVSLEPAKLQWQDGLAYAADRLMQTLEESGSLREAETVFAESRPARARVALGQLDAMQRGADPPTTRAADAFRAVHRDQAQRESRDVQRAMRSVWKKHPTARNALRYANECLAVAVLLDAGKEAADRQALVAEARRLYEGLDSQAYLNGEERDVLAALRRSHEISK
jgi:serine/threonine-protein kinase